MNCVSHIYVHSRGGFRCNNPLYSIQYRSTIRISLSPDFLFLKIELQYTCQPLHSDCFPALGNGPKLHRLALAATPSFRLHTLEALDERAEHSVQRGAADISRNINKWFTLDNNAPNFSASTTRDQRSRKSSNASKQRKVGARLQGSAPLRPFRSLSFPFPSGSRSRFCFFRPTHSNSLSLFTPLVCTAAVSSVVRNRR